MKIVCDRNVLFAPEIFGGDGISLELRDETDITAANLHDVDALIVRSKTRVNAVLLDGTPVRFVGSATIGTDHVDEAALADLGVTFAAAPGSSAATVTQFALATIVLATADDDGPALAPRTLGVIGVGAIGSRVAATAESLGWTVLRVDPPRAEREGRAVGPFHDAADLAHADVVTVHVPFTTGGSHPTSSLVARDFLDHLAPHALLVNTSRGDVVDEAAVLDALATGRLGGVALDVFCDEPQPNANLVRAARIATPHIAGRSLEGMAANTIAVARALERCFDVDLPLRGQDDVMPTSVEPAPAWIETDDLRRALVESWGLDHVTAALASAAKSSSGTELERVFRAERDRLPRRRDLTSYRHRDRLTSEARRFVDLLPIG